MIYDHVLKANTATDVRDQIINDFATNPDALEYRLMIEQERRQIFISIDIDPGGGFEGGFEDTTIYAPIPGVADSKRFAIHHEGFLDEIGKFFGMQDIVTGYPEFDSNVVVKAEDESFVKQVFSSGHVRAVFKDMRQFSFGITEHRFGESHERGTLLEFHVDEAITEPERLLSIYDAFTEVLNML